MGSGSSQLTVEELSEIEAKTCFNRKEIERLYRRFHRLDKNKIGGVLHSDFALIPELSINPIFDRILGTMSAKSGNKEGVITFKDFISTLAVFHPNARVTDKLAFVFRLYDIDDDGCVTRDELFSILKTFVASGFDDSQLYNVVDELIQNFDDDKDGMLSYEEFSKIVTKTDIEERLTISF